MPVIRSVRHDLSLHIAVAASGEMTWRLAWSDTVRTGTVSSLDLLVTMAAQDPQPPIQRLLWRLDLKDAFTRWTKWVGAQPSESDIRPLRRIALHLDEPALASAPWERHLREVLPADRADVVTVRISPVRPRAAQVPFTLPLRLLQLDLDGFDLAACIRGVFGAHPPDTVAQTVLIQDGSASTFADHQAPPDWRTVDVLHLGSNVLLPASPDGLRTADPRRTGSLGWLVRLADAWQTRLVVIEANLWQQDNARQFAAALCARGGPAVVIGPSAQLSPSTSAFFPRFYAALIHDNPIDQAFLDGCAAIGGPGGPSADGLSLFAGQGREELIRVSAPGQKLHDLAEALRSPDAQRGREAAGEVWSTVWESGVSLDSLSKRFTESLNGLEGVRTAWPSWRFDRHEGDGAVPSATQIENIRRAIRPSGTRAARELRPAAETKERFVNPALWRAREDGDSERVDPHAAQIARDDQLVLGIQIGPRDTFVRVIEAQALLEEPFKWENGQPGEWLTIGVSGIDFDVLGHATQQVWLPRAGATDVVEFSLKPRRSGALMLRFCLYFGRTLLQSYRLTAWVGEVPADSAPVRGALARILETRESAVGDARYLARLEYAATTRDFEPIQQDEPVLSIFANDVDGRRAITVWNGEDLDVSTEKNVSLISQQIRNVLDEVSGGRYSDGGRYYAFGKGAEQKGGDPQDFDRALQRLASPGWRLYSSILPKPAREKLKAAADTPGAIVHVGHALLESVIPWALVFDREYDQGKDSVDGLPALQTVCSAGLDDPGGLPPACGQHADCPLSGARQAEQRAAGKLADAETVVCPRHFWGFRYRLELPPMQVQPGVPPPKPRTRIAAPDPASVVIGYNAVLPLAPEHIQDLTTLASSRTLKATISGSSANRSALMKLLERKDIDVLYFFCHARGGQADPSTESPQLEFQETPPSTPTHIGWENLDKFDWAHGPLVFLNGCNTAMFSPDALSPFIRTVVSSCGASGAVGTEIPVFERLAATFAKSFFERMLDGAAAGQALLDTRLEFLRQRNPLGLAYTLYAFSGLMLVQGPAGSGG